MANTQLQKSFDSSSAVESCLSLCSLSKLVWFHLVFPLWDRWQKWLMSALLRHGFFRSLRQNYRM